MDLLFSTLGPVAVFRHGVALRLGGLRRREVLARLLICPNRRVGADALLEDCWGGRVTAGSRATLASHVSQLRRVIGAERLEGRDHGYLLRLEDEELEAALFVSELDAGRRMLAAGDPAGALGVLRAALARWRGPALGEFAERPWASAEAVWLEEQRELASEALIDAVLAVGDREQAVGLAEVAVRERPLRERRSVQLMLSLYRCGRQSEALEAYQRSRRLLVEQLGIEPSGELVAMHSAVLRHDPELDLRAPHQISVSDGSVSVLNGSAPDAVGPEPRPGLPAASAGERKLVTALFAGVIGSGELAERIGAEAWCEIVERFLAVFGECVQRFEGTTDRFTGDGAMALFGAPVAHEHHARRACYAALDLQRQLSSLAAEFRRSEGLEFLVRVGLNSGEVVVDAIGEDLRIGCTAVGHTVELAQRIGALAEPGKVYVSACTAALVHGYFELRDLGPFQVSGASHALHLHQLRGMGAARGRLDVGRAHGLSRFVGREDELALLERALDRSLADQGQVIGIVGQAGVGKSRLCEEFVHRQKARGMPVYHVAGQAHAESVPLMPVLQLMRAYFEITAVDSDRVARERIAARLLLLDERFRDDLPLLFDVLAVPDPERPAERMDPEARQRRLLSVTRRLIHAQSARDPGITVFEDVHWIDSASQVFLANHIDAARSTRSLTVINFRPGYQARWMSSSYYRQIALAPLGADAVERLLADLLGADSSLDGLAELVSERTQGNPFFIEEVVQALVEAGNLEGERGTYRLARAADAITVPASVESVLAARIDRLAAREKVVLQAAAVIGTEFAEAVLARVVELDRTELEDALRELVASEFVYEQELYPDAVYAFRHPLTQEVAYSSQLAQRRAPLHAAVARAIAEQCPDRLEERAALLALHWEAAGQPLAAARCHAQAAAWSGTNDPTQALAHWRRVRQLTDALPESEETTALGLLARIMSLQYAWRLGAAHQQAEDIFIEAERMAATASDIRSQALLYSFYGLIKGSSDGDFHDYLKLARQSVALAEATGDAALYMTVGPALAYALYIIGSYREAAAILGRAIALADGDVTVGAGVFFVCPYAFALIFKGAYLLFLGELEHGRELIEQGIELAREQEDIEVVGWGHVWRVVFASLSGQSDTALADALQALEIAERIGDSFSRAAAWDSLGIAERLTGGCQRALEAIERSQAIATERRTGVEHEAMRLLELAESHLALGDPKRARELIEAGLELARARGQVGLEAHARIVMAQALLASDGPAARGQVEATLARALKLARHSEANTYIPMIHVELAQLALRTGDAHRREQELRDAHRLFTEIGATGHAKRIAHELATTTT